VSSEQSSIIHFVPAEAEADVKSNGLMTAQALSAAGRPEGARHLASYLAKMKFKPEAKAAYDKALAGVAAPTEDEKAVAAMKAVRGDTLADSGGDWVYGFTKGQAERVRGILARNRSKWLDGRVPYEIDLAGLKAADLLMKAENTEARQILAQRIKANRLAGRSLLHGIEHPRIMVKGGVVPPRFLKRIEMLKEGGDTLEKTPQLSKSGHNGMDTPFDLYLTKMAAAPRVKPTFAAGGLGASVPAEVKKKLLGTPGKAKRKVDFEELVDKGAVADPFRKQAGWREEAAGLKDGVADWVKRTSQWARDPLSLKALAAAPGRILNDPDAMKMAKTEIGPSAASLARVIDDKAELNKKWKPAVDAAPDTQLIDRAQKAYANPVVREFAAKSDLDKLRTGIEGIPAGYGAYNTYNHAAGWLTRNYPNATAVLDTVAPKWSPKAREWVAERTIDKAKAGEAQMAAALDQNKGKLDMAQNLAPFFPMWEGLKGAAVGGAKQLWAGAPGFIEKTQAGALRAGEPLGGIDRRALAPMRNQAS
jgi:hypothetical protein